MTDATMVRIVPRRSLLITGLVSILLILLPVSGVFYWYAIPRGQGIWVVVGQAVIVVAALSVLFRQLTVDTVVAHGVLRGRGIFSPMVRVALEKIVTVDLVPVYVGQSPETVWQLLVRGAAGERLYRLRGNFWHPGDLTKVAHALPVAPHVVTEPMSMREFFAAYPGSAYWFENRPGLVAIILTLVIASAIAAAAWIMTVFSMPIG